jgi:hypothetical protein
MKYEANVRWGGTDLETILGTVHNTFAEPSAKEEPGPETFAPGPRRAVPRRKENREEAFQLATERPGFHSVRRIERDLFIPPHALFNRRPTIVYAIAAVREEEQPVTPAN